MKVLSISVLCLALGAIPAVAGTLVVGAPADPGTGNCFPFGCAYTGLYQQVYSSTQFSGAITISSLDFYNTQFNGGAIDMNSGNWDISLSTTSANWNTLSPVFAANLGADNTTVFDGNLAQPWTFGDTLAISLGNSFTYNPADGNLLLTVEATGTDNSQGNIFFDGNGFDNGGFDGNTYLGRVYNGGTVNSGYGLVTGFGGSVATTPEPSSLILLGSGLFGVLGTIRRKIKA